MEKKKSDTITVWSNYNSEKAFLKIKFLTKFSFFFCCQLGNEFKMSLYLSSAWGAENTNICFKVDAY